MISVNMVMISLSATTAMVRCSSDPPISCITFAEWKPASPMVTLVYSTSS